jgi:hypothetical protein
MIRVERSLSPNQTPLLRALRGPMRLRDMVTHRRRFRRGNPYAGND